MTDLDRLIEAVEVGTWPVGNPCFEIIDLRHWMQAGQAFDGSLDAAKRLHDTMLPGWIWNVVDSETTVWPGFPGDPGNHQDGYCEGNPARAWLLSILRAIKAKG